MIAQKMLKNTPSSTDITITPAGSTRKMLGTPSAMLNASQEPVPTTSSIRLFPVIKSKLQSSTQALQKNSQNMYADYIRRW